MISFYYYSIYKYLYIILVLYTFQKCLMIYESERGCQKSPAGQNNCKKSLDLASARTRDLKRSSGTLSIATDE